MLRGATVVAEVATTVAAGEIVTIGDELTGAAGRAIGVDVVADTSGCIAVKFPPFT